ncbi:MAG: HPr family phosphocarrier protein [Rhodospirillaceae bacterium]|nr:HPr family phosphocarrier protein [Rhodospirillaceae bacterium]RPG03333.1 MAG: HPr family phosphocarrier protein [Rhodospirillaceae bacterium TMED63]RZO35880.1 MAG: HPr family phosphocarrier protein [Rhodospirillaceae bacterium]
MPRGVSTSSWRPSCSTTREADSALPGRSVTIVNARGLHARAAAKFTALAEEFDAGVTVSNGRETVGGRSIMGLLMLAAAEGTEISIRADGQDADAALAALCDLVEAGFGEDKE